MDCVERQLNINYKVVIPIVIPVKSSLIFRNKIWKNDSNRIRLVSGILREIIPDEEWVLDILLFVIPLATYLL